jgi:auxin-responsive protein IAA
MDEIKSTNTSVTPEVEVRPRFSSSRFVKVFMQGEVVGRKINLATHQNYASLSFTLKRLGNNYSSK